MATSSVGLAKGVSPSSSISSLSSLGVSVSSHRNRKSTSRKSLSGKGLGAGNSNAFISQPTVVMEIGNAFLRIGFSGESTPRVIIPSTLPFPRVVSISDMENSSSSSSSNSHLVPKNEDEWEQILTPLMESICIHHLLIRARNHRFLLIEPIVTPTSFRNAMTNVLLNTLQVPSLLFLSDISVCPLHANGWTYGIILDMGMYETRVISAFQGRSLFNTFQSVSVGFETVMTWFWKHCNDELNVHQKDGETEMNEKDKVKDLIIPTMDDARTIMEQCLYMYQHDRANNSGEKENEPTTDNDNNNDEIIQNIALRTYNCQIPSTQKTISISMKYILDAWNHVCYDSTNPDSITFAFLSTLLATPLDLRKILVDHLCVVGGGPTMLSSISLPSSTFNQSLDAFTFLLLESCHERVLRAHNSLAKFRPLIPSLMHMRKTLFPSETGEESSPSSYFQKSLMSWIGGSILGSTTELNDERWIYRNVYLGNNDEEENVDYEDKIGSKISSIEKDEIDLSVKTNGRDYIFDWLNVRRQQ